MNPRLSLNCVTFLLLATLSTLAATPGKGTATVRLIDTISSGSSQPGDRFTATLETPLIVNDRVVAEPGTRMIGEVVDVTSSGRLKRPAMVTLRLRAVDQGRPNFPVETGELIVKADSHAERNIAIIGGSAAVGTLIGAAAAGGRGAAIGGLVGAGAGVTGAYLSGKREIVLPSETVLSFHVSSVVISPHELARLQRADRGTDYEPGLRYRHSDCRFQAQHHEHGEYEHGGRHGEHDDKDEDDCRRHKEREDDED